MRNTAGLLGAIFLLAASAGAQSYRGDSTLPASPAPQASVLPSAVDSPPAYALAISPAPGAPGAPGLATSNSSATREPAAQQQPTVFGVFRNYNWQVYGGYTFVRFYEVPGVTQDLNGFEVGMVYYPWGKWIGAEGQLVGAFGSQAGTLAKFALATGGPRFRWSAPRGLELWAHGLVGGAHFVPQTVFGSQSAFAYEVGGGVDIGAHHQRLAYRVGGGMVGTRFFHSYQYSPVVTAGIVFKF